VEEPPIVGLTATRGFSVTRGISIFAGGGVRGTIGEVWTGFGLSTLISVSIALSLVSVEGFSFMRTVIKRINRATTATPKKMFMGDKSKENMICHANEDSNNLAYRLDEICVITLNM